MPLENLFGDLALDATVAARFGGGKLAATTLVTASGDTTVITAGANTIEVLWVSAINDPDAATTPRITVKFDGGTEFYTGYAIAHWEPFTGDVGQDVIVELDGAGSVAVTIHYREV